MSESPDYILDTIVAVATAPGKGGVGIVRISGIDAEKIAEKIVGHLPQPRINALARFCRDIQHRWFFLCDTWGVTTDIDFISQNNNRDVIRKIVVGAIFTKIGILN